MRKKINKKILIFLALILFLGFYLYLAHFLIYYRLGHSAVKYVDRQAIYDIGGNSGDSTSLVYVALGDSFSSGQGASVYEESFPYLLALALAKDSKTNVILKNFSYPGVRSSQLINEQLAQAISNQPDVVTLLIGTNDVHGGVDEEVFKKNYVYILDQLVQKTSAKIYLIGLPNAGTDGLLWLPYNYYFRYQTKEYNKIIKALALDYGLVYIDLEDATKQASKEHNYYSKDLFHPSAFGYQLWAQIIYDSFSK
jgi:lysophospholipase L1-like esterase